MIRKRNSSGYHYRAEIDDREWFQIGSRNPIQGKSETYVLWNYLVVGESYHFESYGYPIEFIGLLSHIANAEPQD